MEDQIIELIDKLSRDMSSVEYAEFLKELLSELELRLKLLDIH